jgi:hypothetical protein
LLDLLPMPSAFSAAGKQHHAAIGGDASTVKRGGGSLALDAHVTAKDEATLPN